MSNWTNEPDGDGWYWVRLRKGAMPEIVKVKGKIIFQSDGPQTDLTSPIVRGWQWRKVKPYES